MSGAEHDREPTVEELKRELVETLNRQTATVEVLRIISSSPSRIEPVFKAILERAVSFCDAVFGVIYRFDGEQIHVVAHHNFTPDAVAILLSQYPSRPGPATVTARSLLERIVVQVEDASDPSLSPPSSVAIARQLAYRGIMSVPMLREGAPIGTITLARRERGRFTDKQVELVTTFADQAVIAIENTRLFEAEQASKRELQESLEYQTAMSDVLGVISRSPNELQPVLDTIVLTAQRLCQAEFALIHTRREDDLLHLAASSSADPAFVEWVMEHPIKGGDGSNSGLVLLEKKTVHWPDALAEPQFSAFKLREQSKARTMLGVPVEREDQVVAVLFLARMTVKPFSQRQIKLVETFADQAVIAIENTRLFEAEQASKRELQESLEYQTATSEVLNVISRSPTNVQPVFDAIASSAAKLCDALDAVVLRLDGDSLRFVAHYGPMPIIDKIPLDRGTVGGRAVLERRRVHVEDLQAEEREYPLGSANAKRAGHRTILSIPLLREGVAIGNIQVRRDEVRRFTAKQIALLETFADQAVIAIENARLFEEVQEKNRALTEANTQLTDALEQQTATSKILRVISASPTDVRPVFETVVENAVRLCDADRALIHRFDGEFLRLAASYNTSPELRQFIERNPIPPGRQSIGGRAALERQTVHIPDIQADPEITYGWRRDVDPIRTSLAVPMLKGDTLLGLIFIYRFEVRPFSEKQIALVETFADQAAIAISNVGLFEEVQARNTELRVALEQQTATSELLKVIGQSTFNIQPVFETLAENAVRLCEAERSIIYRFDGQFLRAVAIHNATPELRAFVEQNPVAPGRSGAAARVVLERRTVQILDVQTDPEYSYGVRQVDPVRTVIAVPILRGDELLGLILIYRLEVRAFTESQVGLLETFADQAGIAIENARLFEEVQARNRDLTALGDVGRAVSSTLDLKAVLKTIVERAVELSGTDGGSIFYFREDIGRFQLGETTGLDEEFVARVRELDIAAGQTGLGEAIANQEPLQMPDILDRPSNPLRDAAIDAGFRAALIVPLLSGDGPLGALVLQRRRPGKFPPAVVSLMQSFADQSAIALENARLFEQIAQKSHELEIASQHKSQFVANMSHELRTPLAAILGYAELIQEGFYGPLPEKSLDALTRIRSNGRHLLGLINTVLDIAKIESGQFTLNMAEYALESVVETVRSATESLAQNKKLALKTDVAKPLPAGVGDEQRLTHVLLNLVGNAIKFTDGGEVLVSARAINGHFNVSVTDTGPGIPEEHQARIFEQFHQVDNSNTKAKGGTGLGLAIAKQIVEMHGGRIWVESTPGKGSTFQMKIPTRAATT